MLKTKETTISASTTASTIKFASVKSVIGPITKTGLNPSRTLRIARESGKDLVEVSPTTVPPVCRILDYGKFLYERSKKEKEARKAQKVIEVKEIQLRPKTTDHHAGFKIRDARRWLEAGMKVKVRIKFRGDSYFRRSPPGPYGFAKNWRIWLWSSRCDLEPHHVMVRGPSKAVNRYR